MAWPHKVAIVGAGYMGRGIAQVLATAGTACVLADMTADLAARALDVLFADAERHEHDGLVAPGTRARLEHRVSIAESIEAAAGDADYIVEAVFEEREAKRRVLHAVEANTSNDTVISTNTSAISIASLSAELQRPERFLGAHWFNPPQFVPGVELIAGPDTRPAALDAVEGLLRRAGKVATRVADRPGFVANRLQYALFQEAIAVVDEGVASPEDVDRVVRTTFGFRLPAFGPFLIADMAGLDVYRGAYRIFEESYPDRFKVPQMLIDSVAQGRLGAKSGCGFVLRSAEQAAATAAVRDRAYVAIAQAVNEITTSSPDPGCEPIEGERETHRVHSDAA